MQALWIYALALIVMIGFTFLDIDVHSIALSLQVIASPK